jgi:hypothetical protein
VAPPLPRQQQDAPEPVAGPSEEAPEEEGDPGEAGGDEVDVDRGPVEPPPESAALGARGIWVERSVLMQRPTRGEDWNELLADARRPAGRANIADQDSNHDLYTLADALVCVRLGEHCDEARAGVLAAVGTEAGARWLAVGRNLGSYVIAADLLDLREGGVHGADGTSVERWMKGWLTKELADNNT